MQRQITKPKQNGEMKSFVMIDRCSWVFFWKFWFQNVDFYEGNITKDIVPSERKSVLDGFNEKLDESFN